MNKESRIWVTGHTGLVGSALVRGLYIDQGFSHVMTATHQECDITVPSAVDEFYARFQPEYVFHCAAKVGGIVANDTQSADFLMQNLSMQSNVISSAHKHGVKRLLFFGSACAYPKFAEVPVEESALLTGELEPTNRSYALAKIAGIEMCNAYRKQYGCDFISCMPTNLYGIGDHYDLEMSHVLPGMIRRIHEAKLAGDGIVKLWGTGTPTREFLFADDLADAAALLMTIDSAPALTNITSGREIRLADLADIVKSVVEFPGEIWWDSSRPDGTPRRALRGNVMEFLGWQSQMPLEDGIRLAYADFLARQ